MLEGGFVLDDDAETVMLGEDTIDDEKGRVCERLVLSFERTLAADLEGPSSAVA